MAVQSCAKDKAQIVSDNPSVDPWTSLYRCATDCRHKDIEANRAEGASAWMTNRTVSNKRIRMGHEGENIHSQKLDSKQDSSLQNERRGWIKTR